MTLLHNKCSDDPTTSRRVINQFERRSDPPHTGDTATKTPAVAQGFGRPEQNTATTLHSVRCLVQGGGAGVVAAHQSSVTSAVDGSLELLDVVEVRQDCVRAAAAAADKTGQLRQVARAARLAVQDQTLTAAAQ